MLMITCNVRASDILVRCIQAVRKLVVLQEFKNAIHRHGQQVIAKLIPTHIRQLIGGYRLGCDQQAFEHLTAFRGQLTAQCQALLLGLREDTFCRLLIYGNHLICCRQNARYYRPACASIPVLQSIASVQANVSKMLYYNIIVC